MVPADFLVKLCYFAPTFCYIYTKAQHKPRSPRRRTIRTINEHKVRRTPTMNGESLYRNEVAVIEPFDNIISYTHSKNVNRIFRVQMRMMLMVKVRFE